MAAVSAPLGLRCYARLLQTMRYPCKWQMCQLVTLCHTGLTYILILDIQVLWHSALSARVSECQKLDLDGVERV